MSRKTASALVFFLAVLLTTVPAWSSMPCHINPADCGKSFTTDLNTAADHIFKIRIILNLTSENLMTEYQTSGLPPQFAASFGRPNCPLNNPEKVFYKNIMFCNINIIQI